MAQGTRRLAMPVAALFGLVVVALIASSWLLNRDALQRRVGGGIDLVRHGLESLERVGE